MLVSIVVPVRDAQEDLRGMLGALAAQAPGAPAFEVIVADDGSATPIPAEVAPPGMDVRVLRLEPRGAYPARNAALDVARGDVVAFTDADCRPVPGWLAAGAAALTRADIVAGAVEIDLGSDPNLWAMLDASLFLDQRAAVREGVAVTANLFARMDDVRAIGGFDAALPGGGDYDLVRRLVAGGGRLVLDEQARVIHPPRATRTALLGKLWAMAEAEGARRERAGEPLRARRPQAWVPAVGRLRWSRRAGLPLAFHGGRPEVVAAHPSLAQHAGGLLPWYTNAAMLRGARAARRAAGPSLPAPLPLTTPGARPPVDAPGLSR